MPDPVECRRAEFLPLSRPALGEEAIAEVVDCLRSGWITTGPRCQRFEEMLAEYLGAPRVVAVSSATAGLHIALLALGAGPGDEVIVPAVTFAATANTVVHCGARPVFVDVHPGTLQIEPEGIERAITPRTRGIVPVHFAGAPVELETIRAIAARHDLFVLEDAAHALGTRYGEELVGSGSDLAVFSFHPIKNITTIEGGAIACRDESLAEHLTRLRFHGISKDAWKRFSAEGKPGYQILEAGFKYNFTDVQAAVGLHQLPRLEEFIARRAELAARYSAALAEIPHVEPLELVPYPHRHAWHLYIVRFDLEALGLERAAIQERLKEARIGCGIHYDALHTQPFYRERFGYQPGDLPNAEDVSARILSLPLFPEMTEGDVDDVLHAVRAIVAG